MPDLANREQREHELAAVLIVLFREWDEIARAGGYAPDRFRDSLHGAVLLPLTDTFTEAAGQMAGAAGVTLDPAEIERQAQHWAENYSPTLADSIAGATDISAPGAFSSARAEKIAVTETTRAVTAAEVAMAVVIAGMIVTEGGRGLAPVWQTAEDERVCPICRPLDGRRKEFWGIPFPNGPPAHPNCRCWLEWKKT